MNRIEYIRKEEKQYHDYCYDNYKLFAEGSWLHKPVKTVIDLLPLFTDTDPLTVLDLGCGVGRNSIPLAEIIKETGGTVVCVDLLDSALEKLTQYSKEYNVEDVIQPVQAEIGEYRIMPNEYDLIVAVSSIEHVESEAVFEKVIQQMAAGTKNNGINCIIVNSEIEEIDLANNEKLDALFEINIPTNEMLNKLKETHEGWDLLNLVVKPLEYTIKRNEKDVLLKANAITFVARKSNYKRNVT